MDAVFSRIRAGAARLPASVGMHNLSISFSMPTPHADVRPSRSFPAPASTASPSRVVYVDEDGHEVQHSQFGDTPWGFVASRYAITLGIMAVVVNRITHICRPQGRPRPLPTYRRLAIQLPTTLFLLWSGVLLGLVTLHSFKASWATVAGNAVHRVVPKDVATLLRATGTEDDIHTANSALLWRLFVSVCTAVVSSTLLRTLEGHTTVVDDLGNSPTFNLVGFALMLHLHASSYSFPPNRHVYLSILFQVCEVFGLQACTCWVSPPITRLSLTTAVGVISTIHYLIATYSGDHGYPFLQSFSRAPDVAIITIIALTLFLHTLTALITSTPLSFSRLVDPRSLPVSSDDYSMALFKLGTACLNSTRLSGLDADMIDIRTSIEPWLEVEGAQVRIRNANGSLAKMEGATGFKNEIRRIRSIGNGSERHSFFRGPMWRQRWKFLVALFGNLRALVAMAAREIASFLPESLRRTQLPAWVKDIPRKVRLVWHGRNGEARRTRRIEEERRRRENLRQVSDAVRARQDLVDGAGRGFGMSSAISSSALQGARELQEVRRRALSSDHFTPQPNSWHRFLEADLGEDSEGEDSDWQDEPEEETRSRQSPAASAPLPKSSYWDQIGRGTSLASKTPMDAEDDDNDEADDYDIDAEQRAEMSTELLALARRDPPLETSDVDADGDSASDDDDYSRMLVAHMSRGRQGSMLTRSAYEDLIGRHAGAASEVQMLAQVIQERRAAGALTPSHSTSADAERERVRLCVICYIEDRTIICWPCKCLALCEGCREAMASRPPPRLGSEHPREANNEQRSIPTHTCPTCRTPVIGFSRIFLP